MLAFRPVLCCAAVLSMLGLPQAVTAQTTTPIKHLIVVVGENTSFDTLFATYQPTQGSSVRNLLSAASSMHKATPVRLMPKQSKSILSPTASLVSTTHKPRPTKRYPGLTHVWKKVPPNGSMTKSRPTCQQGRFRSPNTGLTPTTPTATQCTASSRCGNKSMVDEMTFFVGRLDIWRGSEG